jgi:hypothetical protein
LIRRFDSTGHFGSAARIVLAMFLFFAMSAPLMHVHAAHALPAGSQQEACATTIRSTAAHGDHRHSHQNEPAAPDHLAGGFDCCVHHSPVVSPQVGVPVLARYDAVSSRIAMPDDLVLDAMAANRLERPPRSLPST